MNEQQNKALMEKSLQVKSTLTLPHHMHMINMMSRWGNLSGTTQDMFSSAVTMGAPWLAQHKQSLFTKLTTAYSAFWRK